MKNKKILLAKKFFLIGVLFFGFFLNSEKIFAEKNQELEKKILEIKTQINNLKDTKNYCTDITNYSTSSKIKKDFDEVFFKEKYQISETGLKAKEKFLDEVSVGGFQEIANSFTIQFAGNYCFQRDLKKIDALLNFAIQSGAKMAEKCQTGSVVKIKEIIGENDKNGNPISGIKLLKKKFEDEIEFFEDDLYGTVPKNCQEDSFTETVKKIDELKKKITDLSSGTGDFFDNFSFDLDKIKTQAEKQGKKDAENYVLGGLNNTLQNFGITAKVKPVEEDIFDTTAKLGGKAKNKISNLFNFKENTEQTEISGTVKNFLNTSETKNKTAQYAKIATKFFEKDNFTNNLEENANDEIIVNLKKLENDIVKANGNKEELKEFGIEDGNNKKYKHLKNFIIKFSDFIDKHNESAGTTKGLLQYGGEPDY
ncbi:hypothetical protein LR002_03190 [Candidatus Gracilibacteria bacterium]|nr:hypothetical protein [Candidatus Gracilibacteria bacterium]